MKTTFDLCQALKVSRQDPGSGRRFGRAGPGFKTRAPELCVCSSGFGRIIYELIRAGSTAETEETHVTHQTLKLLDSQTLRPPDRQSLKPSDRPRLKKTHPDSAQIRNAQICHDLTSQTPIYSVRLSLPHTFSPSFFFLLNVKFYSAELDSESRRNN